MHFNPHRWFSTKPKSSKPAVNFPGKIEHSIFPSIVLIHGANQTSGTFEYMRHALPGFDYINLEWSPVKEFNDNLADMTAVLDNHGPVYVVGHSMGGIYAAHLSQQADVIGGATIATPWGGSKAADWAKMVLPAFQVYKDVSTRATPITQAQTLDLPGHWTNYVTTRGNVPGLGGDNDCVLTVKSMTARTDIYTKYIDATHYEIVLNNELIHSLAKNFLRASEKITKSS
jgi:pimeloyl-ACP methyl ester carboxylesterase